MVDPDAVCVLVPTYNEAATIGDVIDRFREQGFENILVIDGGSTDGTQSIATDCGARVRQQSGSGKGQAVREALSYVEAPYVLLIDGDATYRPEQAQRLLEPLFAGEAEHVIGNRFADMEEGAMSRLNRFGNSVINATFERVHGHSFVDILSGYRAFTLASVRTMTLTESGFGIETELSVECAKHDIQTTVVPITYEARPDESETNLRPFRDGGVILVTLYKMTKTNNPLFYFGSVGVISLLTGFSLATYVAVEWFGRGVSHEVIALVAGVSVLFGVQLVLFGVLADLLVTVNREQTQQFERLARALSDEGATIPPDPDTSTAGSDSTTAAASTVGGATASHAGPPDSDGHDQRPESADRTEADSPAEPDR